MAEILDKIRVLEQEHQNSIYAYTSPIASQDSKSEIAAFTRATSVGSGGPLVMIQVSHRPHVSLPLARSELVKFPSKADSEINAALGQNQLTDICMDCPTAQTTDTNPEPASSTTPSPPLDSSVPESPRRGLRGLRKYSRKNSRSGSLLPRKKSVLPKLTLSSPLPGKRGRKKMPQVKCHQCGLEETPEWRRGPTGSRSLCNACGIYYMKLLRKFTPHQAASVFVFKKKTNTIMERSVPCELDLEKIAGVVEKENWLMDTALDVVS